MFLTSASPDTLDVAKVSAYVKPEASSVSPMQRLDSEELRRFGAVYLSEAVRTLSGVSIKDYGGIGGLKTVSIRNLGSAHTTISYDGITISDAQNGQVDISRFFLDDIDEIKLSISQEESLLRSARSLAGSGTLELRSKTPIFNEKSANISGGLTFASFGTYSPKFRYEQSLGDLWAMTATGSYLTSKGNYPFTLRNGNTITNETRLNSDVNIINAELNLYGTLKPLGGRLTSKANIHSSERGLPGSVILYTQNPTERLWDRNILVSSRYENTFNRKWKGEASISYSNAWNRYTDTSPIYAQPQDNRYTQQELALSAVALYSPLPCLKFSLAEDLFGNILDANIQECPFPRRLSSLTALSAQYLGNRLKATAALLGTQIYEHTLKGVSAPNRNRLSPSAALTYSLLQSRMHIRTSYKEGYRVPTFNDLYYARVGNTSLVPEKSRQFNIGATWANTHNSTFEITATADGYINLINDKIVATPTMFIWKMRNVGKVRMSGMDISLNLRWKTADWATLHARGNYSFQHAIEITDPTAKNWGHQIPYTPRHTGNAILSAETKWVTAAYTLSSAGKRYAMPQNIPANLISGYCDHSISLSRSFSVNTVRLHISLEALNLADVNYEVIRYYPMPGRNYRLTLKISY